MQKPDLTESRQNGQEKGRGRASRLTPMSAGAIVIAAVLAMYVGSAPLAVKQYGYMGASFRLAEYECSLLMGPNDSNETAPEWVVTIYAPLMYFAIVCPPMAWVLRFYLDRWEIIHGLHYLPEEPEAVP